MGKREEERRRRRGRKASESSTSYAMQRLLSRNYKAVHADEDILSLYHSSLLYGEVPLTSRMRAVFTSGHVSILIAAAEFVASCVGAVYYLIGTRETMQQKMVWNAGCLAVATFFILVFLLRLYRQAPSCCASTGKLPPAAPLQASSLLLRLYWQAPSCCASTGKFQDDSKRTLTGKPLPPPNLQASFKATHDTWSHACHIQTYVPPRQSSPRSPYSLDRLSSPPPFLPLCSAPVRCLYIAPVRWLYVCSYLGVLDILSGIPIFGTGLNSRSAGAMFQVVYFLQMLKPFTRLQQLGVDITSITQEVINLIVYLTSLIFTAAGIFLWVTYQNEEVKATGSCEPVNCLDYAMSLYFVVVTISTVGYGDILATNAAGRAVVICIIVAALIILPVQLSNISNLLAHRPYGGRFSAASATGMRFVVLTGQLSLLSIQQFLAELYHPLHDK
ncbi:hypothetical protein CLOP_g12654, partial [Closterium sp. NIES-67]